MGGHCSGALRCHPLHLCPVSNLDSALGLCVGSEHPLSACQHDWLTDGQVPWANLGAAPVIVEMDRIFVLATPNSEFQSQNAEPEVSQSAYRGHLSVYNSAPSVGPCLAAAAATPAGAPTE